MKVFAIDMDGTCLNSKNRISEENIRWMHRAKEAGIEIVPTTGRPLACVPGQLTTEKLFCYVITSNGAAVIDTQTGETIFQALLPQETAEDLIRACSGPGLGITAHVNRQSLTQGRLLTAIGRLTYGPDAASTRTVRRMIPYIHSRTYDVEELQFFFFSKKARLRTEEAVRRFPYIAAAYTDHYVELYSENTTKGTALAALAKHLSAEKEEIACIGDAENDIPMFRTAGTRFAMGNSVPSLKSMADCVVSSNDEDGVAEAIRLLLAG